MQSSSIDRFFFPYHVKLVRLHSLPSLNVSYFQGAQWRMTFGTVRNVRPEEIIKVNLEHSTLTFLTFMPVHGRGLSSRTVALHRLHWYNLPLIEMRFI